MAGVNERGVCAAQKDEKKKMAAKKVNSVLWSIIN